MTIGVTHSVIVVEVDCKDTNKLWTIPNLIRNSLIFSVVVGGNLLCVTPLSTTPYVLRVPHLVEGVPLRAYDVVDEISKVVDVLEVPCEHPLAPITCEELQRAPHDAMNLGLSMDFPSSNE